MQGLGALPNLGKGLIEPHCALGPHDLCTTLQPLISECDGGDASSCVAIGQFLADTPPRSMFAIAFFNQACRIGDAAGCERVVELQSDAPLPCASDPLACAWRALRANDRDLHQEACALGAASSCALAAELAKYDAETSRSYQEAGCQLGEPVMCMELGHRLQPGCVASDEQICYSPDPVQANQALQIACAAGWEQDAVCEHVPKP